MTFDDITGDRKLWAVHFEGEDDNEFYKVFNNWTDVVWLRAFFKENIDDLNAYFKITDIKEAISDTIEDSERLRYIIMDISPETDLSKIFRPLDNNQASDVMLQKEKARLKRKYGHSSWLRLYAIKLIQGNYIITGGAIKLTATMQEREHTRQELVKIDRVRRYLLEEGIIDDEGFIEYISELSFGRNSMENRMKSIAQRLEEHASPTPSKWRELFDFLETNKSWLRHSQNIAMLMLDRMEELGMSQKQLAEKMNCSPQYISKVLRGRENLSLETLTKIENALEISIIKGEPVAV